MPARKTFRTKAIVLDRTALAEQDLILTLLAESGEELRAVAKGARKPGGRLAAICLETGEEFYSSVNETASGELGC